LVQYNTRYYSPSMGRFVNRDPLGEQGGHNLYAYVRNNAINRWDHLGMYPDAPISLLAFDPNAPVVDAPISDVIDARDGTDGSINGWGLFGGYDNPYSMESADAFRAQGQAYARYLDRESAARQEQAAIARDLAKLSDVEKRLDNGQPVKVKDASGRIIEFRKVNISNDSVVLGNGPDTKTPVPGRAVVLANVGVFDRQRDAQMHAARATYSVTSRRKVEAGAWITPTANGKYSYTFIISDTDAYIDLGDAPSTNSQALHGHTNRGTIQSFLPGDADYEFSLSRGSRTDILVDPDGDVWEYRGLAGSDGKVDLVASGRAMRKIGTVSAPTRGR